MLEAPRAMATLLRLVVRPRQRFPQDAIRPFLGGRDEREIALTALLVTGQFLYFRVAAPVALDVLGERAMTPETREWILDVAIEHSLRALVTRKEGDGAGMTRGRDG